MSHMTSSKQHVLVLNNSFTKKSLSYENLVNTQSYVEGTSDKESCKEVSNQTILHWLSTYLVLVIWEGEQWNWVIFGPALMWNTLDGAIDTEKSPGLETSLHNSLSVGSECLEPHHQMLHTSLVVWFVIRKWPAIYSDFLHAEFSIK